MAIPVGKQSDSDIADIPDTAGLSAIASPSNVVSDDRLLTGIAFSIYERIANRILIVQDKKAKQIGCYFLFPNDKERALHDAAMALLTKKMICHE